MPFLDNEFGSVVALGSIEHTSEGPEPALKELRRVLRPKAIAIITVPYAGPVRKIAWRLSFPIRQVKAIPLLRRIFRKPGFDGQSLKEAGKEASSQWATDFHCDDGGWHFFEYQFTKTQMRDFMNRNGFQVLEESVIMKDDGILNTFGRIAGCFDSINGIIKLSLIGKALCRLFPVELAGHMLCYVTQRT